MKAKLVALIVLVAALAAVGWDVRGPRRTRLGAFEPAAVAELETRIWRATAERREGAAFRDTARLLRMQYRMPWIRSHAVAYHATHAAFEFKRGRVRADYERALPELRRYYEAIRAVSDTPFDPDRIARLDLEVWIAHRQRELHAAEELAAQLAALQAALHGKPAEQFAEHARLRAEALVLRDQRAENGGASEADWQAVRALLQESWSALARAVGT